MLNTCGGLRVDGDKIYFNYEKVAQITVKEGTVRDAFIEHLEQTITNDATDESE